MTTFITPWGRLWCTGGPQGHVVTGDAFNHWYDMVIRDLPRKKKCVDDVVGWAQSLQQLFEYTIEFLTVVGNHGIIQNPDLGVSSCRNGNISSVLLKAKVTCSMSPNYDLMPVMSVGLGKLVIASRVSLVGWTPSTDSQNPRYSSSPLPPQGFE